jgi:beta-galactosidase beta subunit
MYRIGLKHNGVLIASKELSQKETTNLIEGHLTSIMNLFKTIYKLDISEYRLSEYENHRDYFYIHIRAEDLEKIRDYKLKQLGL